MFYNIYSEVNIFESNMHMDAQSQHFCNKLLVWLQLKSSLAGTALAGREGQERGTHERTSLSSRSFNDRLESLFWLKSSFNMHNKRYPSETLPGNSAPAPLPNLVVVSRYVSFAVVESGIKVDVPLARAKPSALDGPFRVGNECASCTMSFKQKGRTVQLLNLL